MFSEKEEKLVNFIKNSKENFITPKLIEEQLGSKYIGAIGKLIQKGIIEKTSKVQETEFPKFAKRIKGYSIKKLDSEV